MDDKQVWDLFFAGVVSIRCHPRNLENDWTKANAEIEFAARIADRMMEFRGMRCHGE